MSDVMFLTVVDCVDFNHGFVKSLQNLPG